MGTDNIRTIADEPLHLLDDLQGLLERQTKLAQQGKIGDVQLLSKQACPVVERIAETGILELPKFKNRREQLQKLYEDLCLTITAQEADITEKLRQIGKAKKTVRAYRSNIRP
jgi:hypothetical protein